MSLNELPIVSLHRAGGESISFGPGAVHDQVILMEGANGLGVAPVSIATNPVPTGNGSIVRGHRLDERDIFLPLVLRASTANDLHVLRSKIERITSALDKRELTLRIKTPGRDKWREIPVHYMGGLEGNYGSDYRLTHQKIGLEFRAADDLWRGEADSISQQVDSAQTDWLSTTQNFLGVAALSDSTVDAQITVTIAGDAPTYPIWKVTPPGSDLLIVHTTTGERFFLSGLITEPITIDMNPLNPSVTSATYPNGELWDRVSLDSRMFALRPGRNTLEFAMVGGSTESMVHVTYQPRFLGGI